MKRVQLKKFIIVIEKKMQRIKFILKILLIN